MQDVTNGAYPLYMSTQWGLVFSELNGKYNAALIGPRLIPGSASFKANEYFLGIVFQGATSLKEATKDSLLNEIVPLEIIGNKRFVLRGKQFIIPGYDALDMLVNDLMSSDIISASPIAAVSHRDKQRKVKKYIGLSLKQIEQASRVEEAIRLLSEFDDLSLIASQSGFSDQAHMTRDFKRFVGLTPSEIVKYFNKIN